MQRIGQRRLILTASLVTLISITNDATGFAQQIGIGSPFTNVSDSYFERIGFNFGFSFRGGSGPGSRVVGLLPNGQLTPNGNIFFSQGGFGSAVPTFGGYDPNSSARFGFGTTRPGGGGFTLGLEMGKGNSRSIVSTTPSMVVQNGYGGSFSSGQLSPFVTGLISVTGGGGSYGLGPPDNGVTRAMSSGQLDLTRLGKESEELPAKASTESSSSPKSSAAHGELSVAEIKARNDREKKGLEDSIASNLANVEQLLLAGDTAMARVALNKAIVLEPDKAKKAAMKLRLKSMH